MFEKAPPEAARKWTQGVRLEPWDQVRRPAGLGVSLSGDGLEPGLFFRLWVFMRPIRPVHGPLALYLPWHLAPHRESTPPILQCRIFPWEWLRGPRSTPSTIKAALQGCGAETFPPSPFPTSSGHPMDTIRDCGVGKS